MKKLRAFPILSLIGVVVAVLLAVLFRGVILSRVLKPLALAVWLFLRIFVLSVDQGVYWIILIFVMALLAYLRIAQNGRLSQEPNEQSPDRLETGVDGWRESFSVKADDPLMLTWTKQRLISLFVRTYALKERVAANYTVSDAYQRGEIFLPANIRDFLFPEGSHRPRHLIRRWWRRITGKEKADYRRAIEECLDFLESYSRENTV